MKQTLHLCFALCALLFASCGYDDSGILSRLDALEDENKSRIATLQQQIDAINGTLSELQQMDAELSKYITALQNAAKSLEQQIGDTNSDVSDLSNKLDSTIVTLQEANNELSKDIEALEAYVNGELQNNKDWASATFATLEQYNALVANIALIEESIQELNNDVEALEQRMGEKIAEEIATAVEGLNGTISTSIADLETSMKAWVNEQLAGYYTIAEVDAALEALQNSLDENNESLQEDIEELSTKVDNMEAELTEAYKSAIEEAIATNNGVIDGKIADAVATINDRVDSEVAAINARIDALEERIEDLEDALDKIKTLDIVFDIESGKACMAGASIEFGYTIVGGDDATEVESFGDGGWRADVEATDATSGRIRVTAPMYGGNGKVVVLATSGAGASAMKSIRFEEGILTDIADRYEVDWEACTLAVRLKTNVDYEVRIPADAQSWLSVADTRAEVRQDTLTFSVAENPDDSSARTATVELVSELGEVLQSFEIAQKMQPSSDPIQFADQYVKKVCVEKFDTNGDGELSYMEASKVKYIDRYFFGDYAPAVKSFDELQYFVNVTSIGWYAFSGCSSLTSITIPEGVTSIGYNAFSDCPNLKRVNISDLSVWYNISFENYGNPLCSGANLYVNDELVIDIVIPSDIVSLNDYLFSGCTSIRSVVIPEGVTSIGNAAFSGCSSLTSITIPEGVISIGSFAFDGCSSLSSITIPEGVTSIGGYTFFNCSSLTSITIPEGVISIGERAFYGCSSLTSITIPESVVSIGKYAFCGCSSLTSITIPEGVILIREYAFYGCSSLTSITIHEGVTSIGGYVFYNCSSLESVYCKSTTPPAAERLNGYWVAFYSNASGRRIYVPMESVEAYKSADGWADYADSIIGYDFENGVPEYDSDLVTVEIVEHGYFLCSDLVEIPGCEFFANDWYSNKVVFPVEFNIAGEFRSFFAECYIWDGRNDEYSDDKYVESLIYFINQYGSMSTQPTYVILDMNVDYCTYVAMAIDAEGHYSKLAKLKIVTSDEGVNKDITEFKEFWNRMQNS